MIVEVEVSNCWNCPHFNIRALPGADQWDYLCKDREILGDFLPGSMIDKDCPYQKGAKTGIKRLRKMYKAMSGIGRWLKLKTRKKYDYHTCPCDRGIGENCEECWYDQNPVGIPKWLVTTHRIRNGYMEKK